MLATKNGQFDILQSYKVSLIIARFCYTKSGRLRIALKLIILADKIFKKISENYVFTNFNFNKFTQ